MEFPRLVFQDKGPNQRAGGTYSYLSVEDESDFNAAIANGWFTSIPEAIESQKISDAQPTRAELELKATELSIKFDGRTTDRKLNELITLALDPKIEPEAADEEVVEDTPTTQAVEV